MTSIYARKDRPKRINWNLPRGGPYKFRDDGIDFKNLANNQDFDPTAKQQESSSIHGMTSGQPADDAERAVGV